MFNQENLKDAMRNSLSKPMVGLFFLLACPQWARKKTMAETSFFGWVR
jgi:hypothetical protein